MSGVGPKLAQKIGQARLEFDAAAELALCRRLGVSLVARGDTEYPAALENIPDPPGPALRERNDRSPGTSWRSPWSARGAARRTERGWRNGWPGPWPEPVSRSSPGWLAASTPRPTAGRSAPAAGRSPSWPMGSRSIYPPEHEDLARALAESGALVSEMPMRQVPLPGLFTQRNRIISGIALGVVVVEATPRSGSLSTARHAMEQNREVFAVPGPADSLSSRGCHRLIRDGARLVETVDDILEELGPLCREIKAAAGEPAVRHPAELALSDSERSLLGQLDDQPSGVDELIVRTGMTAAQVLATLSVLEVKRLAKRLPGHRFVRA